MYASDVTLSAVMGYAQLGYLGSSGGDITVVAKDTLTLSAATGDPNRQVQIGNGSSFGSGSAAGDMSLTAHTLAISGSTYVTGQSADVTLLNDGGDGGSVGTAANPLNVVVDSLAVHTDGADANIVSLSQGLSVGVGANGIDLGTGDLKLSANGAVTQTAAILAHSVNIATTTGAIALTNAANAFSIATLATSGADNASLADAIDLTITGANIGGNLALSGAGAIGQTGAIHSGALSVSTTGGAINLTNAANSFGAATLATSGADNASLYNADALTIANATIGGTCLLYTSRCV